MKPHFLYINPPVDEDKRSLNKSVILPRTLNATSFFFTFRVASVSKIHRSLQSILNQQSAFIQAVRGYA